MLLRTLIKSRCELIYTLLGAFLGTAIGLITSAAPVYPPPSSSTVLFALGLGFFGTLFNACFFHIFRKIPLADLFIQSLLPGLFIALVVFHFSMKVFAPGLEPLISFLLAALLGLIFGRFICRRCKY